MIINAKITGADIYIEDHGILTFSISVDTSAGWGTSIGQMYLDWSEGDRKVVPAPYTSTIIRKILETVGVTSWKALIGKYIRIDDNDKYNSPIYKIGNILEDKWIDLSEIAKLDN